MIRVDLRYYHRNIRCPSVSRIVGDNRSFCLGISLLKNTDLILLHIYCRKYKIDVLYNFINLGNVLYDHALNGLGHRNIKLPSSLNRLLIGLSCRSW